MRLDAKRVGIYVLSFVVLTTKKLEILLKKNLIIAQLGKINANHGNRQ
jgi:hypothetical protein